MTTDDILKKTGGFILSNKIRAMVNGEQVIVARLIGTEFELTQEGVELLDRLETEKNDKAVKEKAKSGGKKNIGGVDGTDTPPTDPEAGLTV